MKVSDYSIPSSQSLLFILVTNAEEMVVNNKEKLFELNTKLDREIIHFNHLKQSMELIV